MYAVLVLVLALVIAVSAVWSPIFALVIAVPLFVLFLGYVGFSRRADEKATGPSGAPVSGEGGHEGQHAGIWGEKDA
jgi:Sec-independent protein secretion pathway component TatC